MQASTFVGRKNPEKLASGVMVTLDRARYLFSLEPCGDLRWRVNRKGGVKAGDPVGCDNGRGYLRTSVDGRQVLVHRLVWLLTHGEWPTFEIDHRDRNTRNNDPSNLRAANRSINLSNRRPMGESGASGVSRNGSGWQASRFGRYLGTYRSIEEAAEVARQFVA
jgi:hypothetical protein